jgi:hypothetical protein
MWRCLSPFLRWLSSQGARHRPLPRGWPYGHLCGARTDYQPRSSSRENSVEQTVRNVRGGCLRSQNADAWIPAAGECATRTGRTRHTTGVSRTYVSLFPRSASPGVPDRRRIIRSGGSRSARSRCIASMAPRQRYTGCSTTPTPTPLSSCTAAGWCSAAMRGRAAPTRNCSCRSANQYTDPDPWPTPSGNFFGAPTGAERNAEITCDPSVARGPRRRDVAPAGDPARFGAMLLSGGETAGRRVVPADWLRAWTVEQDVRDAFKRSVAALRCSGWNSARENTAKSRRSSWRESAG